jgi:hypothetical protein
MTVIRRRGHCGDLGRERDLWSQKSGVRVTMDQPTSISARTGRMSGLLRCAAGRACHDRQSGVLPMSVHQHHDLEETDDLAPSRSLFQFSVCAVKRMDLPRRSRTSASLVVAKSSYPWPTAWNGSGFQVQMTSSTSARSAAQASGGPPARPRRSGRVGHGGRRRGPPTGWRR